MSATTLATDVVQAAPQAPAVSQPVYARAIFGPKTASAPRHSQSFSGRRIHFMGAGGIGVSAMMELCAARGAVVSGCDCSANGQFAALRARGVAVHAGHSADHIADCDELVHTAAVPQSHPEVQEALRQGKAVSARMHLLGRIAQGTRAICVTGAHGKTTTTWLCANMLIHARRDPSVLVGGVVRGLNGNVRVGRGEEFVAEVDESDNKLHEVVPTIPILTNIDNDHLDNYGTVDAIEAAVTRFMSSLDTSDPQSLLIGCGDDARVRRRAPDGRDHRQRLRRGEVDDHHVGRRCVVLRLRGLRRPRDRADLRRVLERSHDPLAEEADLGDDERADGFVSQLHGNTVV